MGVRGPVPKHSSERRRRNKETQPDQVRPIVEKVEMPKASSTWHPIAKAWYESLAVSGQSAFFEPSDWAAARYVAEAISLNMRQKVKFSSMLFSAVWDAMGDLLTTEAARRRVRMEIDRSPEQLELAGVTALEDYRKSVGV
jgi:hypothetical protein